MNFCVFIGRLTKDPELRTTQSGKSVSSFSLAVKRIPEGVDFIDCVAWNRAAEIVTKYAKKGHRLAVTGQMRNRTYEDRDGRKVTKSECVIDTLELLEHKSDNTSETPAETPAETPRFEPIPDDGDLPF